MVMFCPSKPTGIQMRITKSTTLLSLSLLSGMMMNSATAAETIKVGVLHSLSGTMAISETTLKDTMLMKLLWLIQRLIGHCLLKKPAN
jgi:hypothetical protein